MKNLYNNEYLLYGKRNWIFYVLKILRVTPVFGFFLGVLINAIFILSAFFSDVLFPQEILNDFSNLTFNAFWNNNDNSYLFGDKMTISLMLILPLTIYIWIRHIAIIHPKAIRNIQEINNKGISFLEKSDKSINNIYIELFGVLGAIIAVIVYNFIICTIKWIKTNLILEILYCIFIFLLWYVIITFISKGFILIVKKYFHIESGIKYFYDFPKDPFQIKHFFHDVLSVFYFIGIGGLVLFLFTYFPCTKYKTISTILFFLYFLIFPFWLVRYGNTYKKLKEKKEYLQNKLKKKIKKQRFMENSITDIREKVKLDCYSDVFEKMERSNIIPLNFIWKTAIVFILNLSLVIIKLIKMAMESISV